MSNAEFLVEMKDISKSFPGVMALDQVSLQVRRGTVHALMGENGAGKSTLMKILTGLYSPDKGQIFVNGTEISLQEPKDAYKHGIAMIHQELSPVLEMTIAENIFLGREPVHPITRFVDDKKLCEQAGVLLRQVDLALNPKRKMKDLSVSEMQMVEIVKAISYDFKVIIMDEPTSAITDREVEKLFDIIRRLKQDGKAIIYISHKMDEIFKISDEITVFRDGRHIVTNPAGDFSPDSLITSMVGRELKDMFPKIKDLDTGHTVLKVAGIAKKGKFKPVSFEVRKGEILGITGLMGAGRTEVMESVFGIDPIDEGAIFIDGVQVQIASPIDAIRHGLAFVTEDRKEQGLFLSMTIRENASISSLRKFMKAGLIHKKGESSGVKEFLDSLRIKAYSQEQEVGTLSGGNQQKVVLAKWLLTRPKVLLLDEPTRGIDIGAKTEIYRLMSEWVKAGMSIIMISSELPEIIGMSDRILVFHERSLAGELSRAEATQEKILQLATGHRKEV